MENSPSIRSFSRARTTERGFALVIALVLALLYFGLIELLLVDSSRELAAARRFRARILAETLAENAAEGAALRMADETVVWTKFELTNEQGEMEGEMRKSGQAYVITAKGISAGLESTQVTVRLQGQVVPPSAANPTGPTKITIDFARHTQ
jgi:Tfp pilus assembly protein PilX